MFTSRRSEGYRQYPRQEYRGSQKNDSLSSRRMAVHDGDLVRSPTVTSPRASEQRKSTRINASHRTQAASRKEPRSQDTYSSRVIPQNSTSKAGTTSASHDLESKREPSPARRPRPVRIISTLTIAHSPEKAVSRHPRPAPRNLTERRPYAPVEKDSRPVRHVHWA